MKFGRTIIVLVAIAITLLFAWQANTPAYAKPPTGDNPPVCRGNNLLTALKEKDQHAYDALLKREAKVINGTGLLWKIERPGLEASYLFGTMHVSDERLTNLPAPVNRALNGAKTVALELDEALDDKKMQMAVMKNIGLIAFTDGTTLDSVLSGDELKLLKSTLQKYQMPYFSTRVMKPWFVSLSLALPLCELARQKAGYKALDGQIGRNSQKKGAKVLGLETVKEQFAAFDALSIENQKDFLISSLRMNHLLDDQIETMKQLYLQGRTAAIWEFAIHLTEKFARDDESKGVNDALARFQEELVVKRNKVMAERALPLLDKGSLFIGVGALHLPGENGLVSLLQKAGYKVTRVH